MHVDIGLRLGNALAKYHSLEWLESESIGDLDGMRERREVFNLPKIEGARERKVPMNTPKHKYL